jgi:hypothetical protein
MKNTLLTAALCLALFSCSKDDNNQEPTPAPPVNNGPIGGNYNLTGLSTTSYDTIPGSGMVTINEYTTTSANLKGSITISATAMNSKGLMYDFTTTGVRKEVNTTTGATVTTNMTPSTGSRGQSTSSVSSNYTINTGAGELTIDDAQYLFNPAFISQPGSKKHKYTLSGNVLKVITEHYDASTRYRVVNEAMFTKQ